MTDEKTYCKNCGKEIYLHKEIWFHHGMVIQCTFDAEPKDVEFNSIFDRMVSMEAASQRNPNLMQTYEVMWKALKEEIRPKEDTGEQE